MTRLNRARSSVPADSSEGRVSAVYRLLSQVFIELDDGDKRFFRALSQALWQDTEEYTLTIPHFWALVHLGPDEGRTMAELAQLLICDKSNVTAIVDKLETRQWAERVRGKAGDRRFMRVVLTTSGRAIREQMLRAHTEWVRRRFSMLSPEQLDHISALLAALQPGFALDPEAVVADVAGSPLVSGLTPASRDARSIRG